MVRILYSSQIWVSCINKCRWVDLHVWALSLLSSKTRILGMFNTTFLAEYGDEYSLLSKLLTHDQV